MAWVGSNSSTPAPAEPGSVCEICRQPNQGRLVPLLVESDSFGAEYAHVCEGCRKKERQQRNSEPCERCKQTHPDGLIPMRDVLDEGMEAPTYYYCPPCHKKRQDAIDREIREHELRYGEYDYFDYRDEY